MLFFTKCFATCIIIFIICFVVDAHVASASYHFSNFKGVPPIHVAAGSTKSPTGLSPDEIKTIYHLPKSGGRGTIAIVGAYDDKTLESDLAIFDKQFNLPACTIANGCLTKHAMSSTVKSNSGWSMETSLDIEWSHAIAPNAKILLVEATTQSGANLLSALDYAAARTDTSAISMSWGGEEFPEEVSMDSHFVSRSGAPFFASSGDNGTGASWPASSPKVIGVGGTSLTLNVNGTLAKQTAWNGSGGGVSAYEKEPSFQSAYSIPRSNGMRAIPDVSYDADPNSGFSIVEKGKWHLVGGTSAGAPQWAAIAALGSGTNNPNFYSDKAGSSNTSYFSDITSGSNGSCSYYCDARAHYDYVTGLGSPLTVHF